ncbi:hypothetical protein MC885_002470 [Smutsia gigantea]|nr:hypothetical protein MC885_002470 [Smutsia gigantea]
MWRKSADRSQEMMSGAKGLGQDQRQAQGQGLHPLSLHCQPLEQSLHRMAQEQGWNQDWALHRTGGTRHGSHSRHRGRIQRLGVSQPSSCCAEFSLQFLQHMDVCVMMESKYSAVSLCNISTEVLKVINATEELLAESAGPWESLPALPNREKGTFPLGTDQVRLDEQLTSLEENVYLAAGTVYGLEGQLNELEDAARCIHSGSDETELAHLEDQVATAAAQVHQAEVQVRTLLSTQTEDHLAKGEGAVFHKSRFKGSVVPTTSSVLGHVWSFQISDIESRISALTIAGLNIAPCVHLTRKRDQKQRNQVQTIDTSRQQRRKLPAPPGKGMLKLNPQSYQRVKLDPFELLGDLTEKTEASSVTIKTFNRNFILQGSSIDRTAERKSSSKDPTEPAQESAAMY